GCAQCRSRQLAELNGLAGRTVVAEMIEPGADDVFLQCVRQGDNIRLRRHLAQMRAAPFDAPDMHGKSAMECAIYKALHGQIDPRDVEARFKAFETVALERAQQGRA